MANRNRLAKALGCLGIVIAGASIVFVVAGYLFVGPYPTDEYIRAYYDDNHDAIAAFLSEIVRSEAHGRIEFDGRADIAFRRSFASEPDSIYYSAGTVRSSTSTHYNVSPPESRISYSVQIRGEPTTPDIETALLASGWTADLISMTRDFTRAVGAEAIYADPQFISFTHRRAGIFRRGLCGYRFTVYSAKQDTFGAPVGFDDSLWLSETTQAVKDCGAFR